MAIFGTFIAAAGCTMENGEADSELYDQESMENSESAMDDYDMMQYDRAVALIHSNNSGVEGWITFTQMNGGVQVQAELSGLTDDEHGIHIHKFGDCRADDYSSAGPHYNPANEDHDAPTDQTRHMGDMGNIMVNADGTASMEYMDSVIDINKIMGRGVIVHQGTDDLTSQPSGAAGARIACGVIGIVEGGNTDDGMGGNSMQGDM